jgi:hypothetical protein
MFVSSLGGCHEDEQERREACEYCSLFHFGVPCCGETLVRFAKSGNLTGVGAGVGYQVAGIAWQVSDVDVGVV